MGYNTDYFGQIEITPALTPELRDYINKFSTTRRMKRDVTSLKQMFNGQYGFDGNYGTEGEYFVGGVGEYGQDKDGSVLNYNQQPDTQPGLWCQWVITEDGKYIEWDQGEKFYSGAEWMEYIIDNFLKPKGYVCNGSIDANGEDYDDLWTLNVNDNVVTTESRSPNDLQDTINHHKEAIDAAKDFITGYKIGILKLVNGDMGADIKVESVFSCLDAVIEKLKVQ